VETNETAVVTYQCPGPDCGTVVTVGAMTTDIEAPLPPDAPGVH
jgi:hypothetical protein